ncbi:MAG: LytR C-terminal domain-containing protein [Ignavibacteria bacterium]|nr:LytR C-terminal domain-containing protein [Ignavibacteria bacterium]
MKIKTQETKLHKKPDTTIIKLFLNISILILSLAIIFLGYSLLSKIKAIYSQAETSDSLLQSEVIQVEVLNGCGVSGIADKFMDILREKKFDVVNLGNYRSFDIYKTIVIDRSGKIKNAEYLAEVIGIDKWNVIQQKNKNYFLDVSLIIGKDYNNFLK